MVSWGDGAGDKEIQSTDTSLNVADNTSRDGIAKMTSEDDTLKVARTLADREQNGFKWDEGLLFKYTLDQLGNPSKRLCVPKPLRLKCLSMAQEKFGHSGKNKVGRDLAKSFYWPSLYSDVAAHCRSCDTYQLNSKAKPRHTPMVEREVVTVPGERVAIDLVGPLPKARGGFEYMLTCVDLATRCY